MEATTTTPMDTGLDFSVPFHFYIVSKKKKTRFTFPKAVETFFEHLTDWVVF